MRTLLTVLSVVGLTGEASGVVFPGGTTNYGGAYGMSLGPLTSVGTTSSGNDLFAATLRVSNVSGDPDFDINGIADVTIGSNGALHHEQNIGVIPVLDYLTPTLDSWALVGLTPSAVDSHFLQSPELVLPGGDPTETRALTPSGAAPESLNAVFPLAGTGFGGVLTGSYTFATTESFVDIAYLVFDDEAIFETGIDLTLRPTNAAGQSETITDCIGVLEVICQHDIPEPSSGLLIVPVLAKIILRRPR